MALRDHTLSDRELRILDDLYRQINELPGMREYVRATFRGFLRRISRDKEIKSFQVARLLSRPSSVKYNITILIYDYTISDLSEQLKRAPIGLNSQDSSLRNSYDDVLSKINELLALRRMETADSDSLHLHVENMLRIGDAIDDIPPYYANNYFGYRRSSNIGDIIRFYISITRGQNDKRVYFTNEYVRRGTRWLVNGFGLYLNRTLYLIGHARARFSGESLGLRFFALRRRGTTKIIEGVLISMDQTEQPIASRIVLVPVASHRLSKKIRELRYDEMIIESLEESQSGELFKSKILSELRGVFDEGSADKILRYIDNLTFTVLKASPELPGRHLDLVTELRNLCVERGFSMEEKFGAALGQYLVRTPDELPYSETNP